LDVRDRRRDEHHVERAVAVHLVGDADVAAAGVVCLRGHAVSLSHRGGEMGSVVIDMSMSLDGYIAAPNDNPEQGLGEDGMRLHNWAFDDPSVFEAFYGDLVQETGAVIMGRRSYDNSIEAWGGKAPFGDVPCF